MKKIYKSSFLVMVCFFLSSCGSNSKTVRKDTKPAPKKDKSFIQEIEQIQKENKVVITSDQRKEINKKDSAGPTTPTTPAAPATPPIKTDEEVEPESNLQEDLKNQQTQRTAIKVAAPLPPPKTIEEVTIEKDPTAGLLIDETIVDDFEERFAPITEEQTFTETEESKILEESSALPVEDEIDEEALKDFEDLKKLKDVAAIDELEEIKKAEKLFTFQETTYDIPIVINKQVEHFLDYFQGRARKIFQRWLNRSTKYLPMMREVFEKKGLPLDLTYLAMIESGFNTSAYSKAHAVGPWQFIKGTGAKYGLRIDYWVDERNDPYKSTIAAANYLSDLYNLFNSWYLAAAAYNAGEGKIGRAIKMHNTEDFWEMSKYRYLKLETKNYIPKLLAATLISKSPDKYGFNEIEQLELYDFDLVDIPEPTDLEVIARSAGVSMQKIKELNPELKRWYTPPDKTAYQLKIPKNTKDKFLQNYAKLKPTEKVNFLTYRIKHGQSLSYVAQRFNTTVASIMNINKISDAKRVRAGIELIIPVKDGTGIASYKNKNYEPKIERAEVILVPRGETVTYTVKKNDTLWDIAQRGGIKITDLIKLNNMNNSIIKPGDKLYLYKEPEKFYAAAKVESEKTAENEKNGDVYYTVKNGDNLWDISIKFDLTADELKKLNNLNRRSIIHPGDKLLVANKTTNTDESVEVASVTNQESKFIVHTVKKGDTLWNIAKMYNISLSDIKSLNNLRDNNIKPGDELRIKNAEI